MEDSATTLYLRHDSSSSTPRPTSITVSFSGGVDVGLVAGALGLNPNSVRLNGYHVSNKGVEHVSCGLTWAELLYFFARRGLPSGMQRDGDAIVVQGKLLHNSDSNDRQLKRKLEPELESSVKKTKLKSSIERKSEKYNIRGESSNNKRINIKKRLSSEDGLEFSLKKIKIAESDTGTQESCTGTHLSQVSKLDRSFVSLSKLGKRKIIES